MVQLQKYSVSLSAAIKIYGAVKFTVQRGLRTRMFCTPMKGIIVNNLDDISFRLKKLGKKEKEAL